MHPYFRFYSGYFALGLVIALICLLALVANIAMDFFGW
jgi:hypothetical protein